MTFTTRPADQPRHHREQLRGHRSCPPSFRLPGRFHSVVGYPSFRRSLVSPLLLSTVSPSAAKSFLFGGFSFLCFAFLCFVCLFRGKSTSQAPFGGKKCTKNDTFSRDSRRKTRITSYHTADSHEHELFEELMHQAGDGIPLQVRYRHTQKSLKSRQCPFRKRQLIERRIDDLM